MDSLPAQSSVKGRRHWPHAQGNHRFYKVPNHDTYPGVSDTLSQQLDKVGMARQMHYYS